MIFFPQLEVLIKCTVGIVEGDDEAFGTEEKPALKKVAAEEGK